MQCLGRRDVGIRELEDMWVDGGCWGWVYERKGLVWVVALGKWEYVRGIVGGM